MSALQRRFMSAPTIQPDYSLGLNEGKLLFGAHTFPLENARKFWVYPNTNEILIAYPSSKGKDHQACIKLQLGSIEKTQKCVSILLNYSKAIPLPPELNSITPELDRVTFEFTTPQGAIDFSLFYAANFFPVNLFSLTCENCNFYAISKTQVTDETKNKIRDQSFKGYFTANAKLFCREESRIPKPPLHDFSVSKIGYFIATPTKLDQVNGEEIKSEKEEKSSTEELADLLKS